MSVKFLISFVLSFCFLTSLGLAQDQGVDPVVDYRIEKMKNALKLTDTQVDQIRPIITDYLNKREAILEEAQSEGILDHSGINLTLKALKEKENQGFQQVLTPDQMDKWKEKENQMASLNPDSGVSSDDDGPTMTPDGARFKF